MAELTVLGAGYMGAALAMVAADRGHRVRLWGTWLDDDLVGPTLEGRDHPRLRLPLHPGIRPLRHGELAEALRGADAVVCAVNSDGVIPVMRRAAPLLPDQGPLLSVTKGFLSDDNGRIRRISEELHRQVLSPAGKGRPLVHIGGPCKAMEVARRVPSTAVYACEDRAARDRCADWLETDYYTLTRTADQAGAEVCSAFKNAYATSAGLCDGLQLAGHPEMYNTKAAMFAQAIAEIAAVVRAMGGGEAVAYGLCGVGDLHVTAAAGRNRTYGEHVGRGERPDEVAERMRAAGELTEGYPALDTGFTLVQQLAQQGQVALTDFPLLAALHRIVYRGADVYRTLAALRVRV